MKLALDIEGVIADSHGITYERSEMLDREVDGHDWGFSSDEHLMHFLELSELLWREDYESIPLVEEDTPELVREINNHYDVDIVTSRMNVRPQLVEYLDMHDIEYNDLYVVDRTESKSQLDYDVYVDDKPALAKEVDKIFLYDQPYNRGVQEGNGVIRVESLSEVITYKNAVTATETFKYV